MEVHVKELIEKIKNEGVAQAETEAKEILSKAEKQAHALIKEAEEKAAQTLARAQAEAEKTLTTSREAIKQSARDLLLTLEKKILQLFQSVVKETSETALSEGLVEKILVEMAKAWASADDKKLLTVLSSADFDRFGKALQSKLAQTVKGGVEIVPSERFQKGFRVGMKGGNVTVDYSAEGLTEAILEQVQPSLAAVLREALK